MKRDVEIPPLASPFCRYPRWPPSAFFPRPPGGVILPRHVTPAICPARLVDLVRGRHARRAAVRAGFAFALPGALFPAHVRPGRSDQGEPGGPPVSRQPVCLLL